MIKHNQKRLIVILAVIALFVVYHSNNLSLFSITPLELQNKKIPFILHNSKVNTNYLGDTKITSSDLMFICKSEIATLTPETRELFSGGKTITQTVYVPSWNGLIYSPNPRNECWKTTLQWGATTYNLIQGQKHTINKYVNFTFDGSNSFVTFGVEKLSTEPRDTSGKINGPTEREWVTYYGIFKNDEDEKRLFWFEVDTSFLQLRWKSGNNILRVESNDNPTILVNNDLVDNLKAELLIKIHKTITQEEMVITLPLTLNKNEGEYIVKLPKETLGGLVTEAKLSVDFLGVKIFSKNTLKRTFNIIPNVVYDETSSNINLFDDNTEVIESKENINISPKKVEQSSIKSFILIVFFVITLMFILKLIKNNGIQT